MVASLPEQNLCEADIKKEALRFLEELLYHGTPKGRIILNYNLLYRHSL